jgi:hypothetical protein
LAQRRRRRDASPTNAIDASTPGAGTTTAEKDAVE